MPGFGFVGAPDRAWMVDAKCAATATPPETTAECDGCPVVAECLGYARAHSITTDIWGALTPTQRRADPGPLIHGTARAYDRLGCRCAECRALNAARARERSQ